jgi:hypothetical protein
MAGQGMHQPRAGKSRVGALQAKIVSGWLIQASSERKDQIMLWTRRFKRLAWMSAGLAIGLAVGIALAVGVAIGMRNAGDGDVMAGLPLEELKLKAYAAHGSDTFAIATGPVDGNVDGVFCLDFLTGDLTGFVMSPRQGRFFAAFKTNVVKELPVEQGKSPKYAMALGRISVLSSYSNVKPGASVIYVADCNSGIVAAYAFPWNPQVTANPPSSLLAAQMITLDVARARDLKLRE